jgi:hypothetical protein
LSTVLVVVAGASGECASMVTADPCKAQIGGERSTAIWMTPRSVLIPACIVGYFCFLALLIILANPIFFNSNTVFTQDFAGTALAVFEAKSFDRIQGVPSWTGIHSLGPIYFYWRAIFEYIGDAFGFSYIAMALVSQVALIICSGIGAIAILKKSTSLGLGLSGGLVALTLASETQNGPQIGAIWEPFLPISVMLPFLAAVYAASTGSLGSAIIAIILGIFILHLYPSAMHVVVLLLASSFVSLLILRRNWLALTRELPVSAKILAVLFFSMAVAPLLWDAFLGFPNARAILQYQTWARTQPSLDPATALGEIGAVDAGWIGSLADYLFAAFLILLIAFALFRAHLLRFEDELLKLFVLGLIVVIIAYGMFRSGPTIYYSPPHMAAYTLVGLSLMFSVVVALLLGRLLWRWPHLVPGALFGLAFLLSFAAYRSGKLTWPLGPAPYGIINSKPLVDALAELEKAAPKTVVIDPVSPPDGAAATYEEKEYPISMGQSVANAMARASIPFCLPPKFATGSFPNYILVLGARYCDENEMQFGTPVRTYCADSRLFIEGFGKPTDVGRC